MAIVQEYGCRFGLRLPNEEEFVPLSNFIIEILREVEAGRSRVIFVKLLTSMGET